MADIVIVAETEHGEQVIVAGGGIDGRPLREVSKRGCHIIGLSDLAFHHHDEISLVHYAGLLCPSPNSWMNNASFPTPPRKVQLRTAVAIQLAARGVRCATASPARMITSAVMK